MREYSTEAYEPSIGITERLHAEPMALTATHERRAALPTWAMFALLVVVLLLVLARLPQEAPVQPVAAPIYTDSRVCVLVVGCN